MIRLLHEKEQELAASSEVCQMLVLCEDLSAFLRVYLTVRRLQIRFADSPSIEASFWSFEDIEHAPKTEAATRAAASADILIVAVTTTAVLPPSVGSWLGNVIGRERNGPPALAAFIVSEATAAATNSALIVRLKQLAEDTGMEWLPVQDRLEIAVEPQHADDFPEPHPIVVFRQDANWVDRDVSHWGINE